MAARTFRTDAPTTDWHTPGNWTEGAIPTSADDVTIAGGVGVPLVPVLSGAGACKTLTTNGWSGIDLGGFTLTIHQTVGQSSNLNGDSGGVGNGTVAFSAGTLTAIGGHGCNIAVTGTGLLQGGGIFGSITLGSGTSVQIFSLTLSGAFTASGATLVSGGPVTADTFSWTGTAIDSITGTITTTAVADSTAISNCDFSGGVALEATNSDDDGGNTNVNFAAPPAPAVTDARTGLGLGLGIGF